MVVAINSCLQVDLTGQICADPIGHPDFRKELSDALRAIRRITVAGLG